MNAEKHALNVVWDDYKREMGPALKEVNKVPYERIIADLLSVGEFYYYTLNIGDSSINNFHENILRLHRIKNYPRHLSEIISLIHPDDIPFVIEAERLAINKLREIGWQHKMNLKSSYCFRMRTDDGTYQLFHHQALTIKEDESGKMVEAINIHTNIQHITAINSYTVLISGISPRTDFYQIGLKPELLLKPSLPQSLTKRELEILKLIAQGHSSNEIADLLFLSSLTVRTHRKNILRKTEAKNGSDLVKRCIEWGLI
ncbi:LuxR C-terminal-related transcriptional regulator [Pedobacter sp.]